jgi:hypothetical protein
MLSVSVNEPKPESVFPLSRFEPPPEWPFRWREFLLDEDIVLRLGLLHFQLHFQLPRLWPESCADSMISLKIAADCIQQCD